MHNKNNKFLIIGLIIFVFSLYFLFGKNTADTQQMGNDFAAEGSIEALLKEVSLASGGEIMSETTTDVTWTTSGPGLGLTDGRMVKLKDSDFNAVKSYFSKNGWGTEDMFWAYKTDVPSEVGYLTKDISHPYAGAMCITNEVAETVRCGFGPSGN